MKLNEKDNRIFVFVDFKGAFDAPLHNLAWKILEQQGYPLEIIKQIFWLYGKVKINKQKIGRGFLQGGITSPRLYIQYQQQILQEIERKLKDMNIKFNWLGFADDLVIEAQNTEEYETIISIFTQQMEMNGLILN